jgi:hypothetical protein
VTVLVTSSVLPSVYVPITFNGRVVPSANDPFDGVIASDTRAAGPTVKLAAAEIEPSMALIDAPPTAVALANPVALMLAALLEELHDTVPVRSWVEPSV